MDKIHWGVLSVSNHYKLRVHGELEDAERSEVVAIASRNKERATEAAEALDIPRAFGSYEALLADPGIDAVYIPLPNNLHAAWVKAAAAAGKHVLCEKPFAMNAAETAEALDFATSKKVLVMEAFMYRFHPQWIHARKVIRSGELGKIINVQAQFTYTNKDPKNIRNIKTAGGGALMDIGCYAASCSRFIMGSEPHRVISLIGRDPQFGTDTMSSGILDFGGAQAQFVVSTQAYLSQRVEVLGTNGRMSIPVPFNPNYDVASDLWITSGLGTRRVKCGPAGQYRLMFDAFSKSISEGLPAPTSPEDAIANAKTLDALFRSESTGHWVEID